VWCGVTPHTLLCVGVLLFVIVGVVCVYCDCVFSDCVVCVAPPHTASTPMDSGCTYDGRHFSHATLYHCCLLRCAHAACTRRAPFCARTLHRTHLRTHAHARRTRTPDLDAHAHAAAPRLRTPHTHTPHRPLPACRPTSDLWTTPLHAWFFCRCVLLVGDPTGQRQLTPAW